MPTNTPYPLYGGPSGAGRNDLGAHRMAPHNACKLLRYYLHARRWRLNRDLASRYAICGMEQVRNHSGSNNPHPRPDKQLKQKRAKWPTSNRIIACPERVLHLLNGTWHTSYTLRDLDHNPQVLDTAICAALQAGRNALTLTGAMQQMGQAWQALANYRKVTRLRMDDYLWMLDGGSYYHRGMKPQLAWVDLDKGKQLFIPGLGRYDIAKVAKAIERGRTGRAYNPTSGRAVTQPIELMAYGYELREMDVRAMLADQPTMDHVVRYWDWYCIGNNKVLMDEAIIGCRELAVNAGVAYDAGYHRINPDTLPPDRPRLELEGDPVDHHPTTLINAVRAWEPLLEEYNTVRLRQNSYPKLPPLADEYPWVPEVMVEKQIKVKATTYTLTPLATRQSLKEAGAKLHNCAGSYKRVVQDANCLLFTIKKQDKYVGLVEVGPDGNIEQAVGQCNARMPTPIRRVANQHGIRPWDVQRMAALTTEEEN